MLDVQSYLNHQHLSKLFHKTTSLNQLNQALLSTIPPHITQYCKVANFNESNIVIGCGNASLMLEAKRYESVFINVCQKYLPQCYHASWKIIPSLIPEHQTIKVQRHLSQKAKKTIELASRYIEHQGLKSSLERLSES